MTPRVAAAAGVAIALAAVGCAGGGAPSETRAARFDCRGTLPNGQTPPGEHPTQYDIGNGRLWTLVPTNGKLAITASTPAPPGTVFGEVRPDGSLATKFPWWGAATAGSGLRITGTRLDRRVGRLRARIAGGSTSAPHFWATRITFASPGCWRVTGSAGTAKLTFVLDVMKG